ncbi:unnamed protein product [Urochloa humidicola]
MKLKSKVDPRSELELEIDLQRQIELNPSKITAGFRAAVGHLRMPRTGRYHRTATRISCPAPRPRLPCDTRVPWAALAAVLPPARRYSCGLSVPATSLRSTEIWSRDEEDG